MCVPPTPSMMAIEYSHRNLAFDIAPAPSPVFSGLTLPVFVLYLSITPSSIFTFTIGYNPLPCP